MRATVEVIILRGVTLAQRGLGSVRVTPSATHSLSLLGVFHSHHRTSGIEHQQPLTSTAVEREST